MVEWNSVPQRREYAPEEPDKLVVNLTQILRRKSTKRILDLGCGAGRQVLHHYYVDEKELKVPLRNFRKIELKIEEEKINSYLRSRIIAIAEK